MNTTTNYPRSPGWKARDTETSCEAAAAERLPAGYIREQVERLLARYRDCTADEAAEFLGLSVLAVRPRFSELKAQGKLEDSGLRRKNASGKNAVAWRAVRNWTQGSFAI